MEPVTNNWDEALRTVASRIETTSDMGERVRLLNEARQALTAVSPFKSEPVDCVTWVPADSVEANDYNPNAVAPPEMELLRLSVMADGYTQPIVANQEDGRIVVVDGFHRNRVGKDWGSPSRKATPTGVISRSSSSAVTSGTCLRSGWATSNVSTNPTCSPRRRREGLE